MSTADFRSRMLGRKSPVEAPAPEPEAQADAEDFESDTSFSDADSDLSQESVEEELASDNQEVQSGDDWSWAENLKAYREGVHGLATHELLEALASGTIPESLMDKLSLTMKDGDEEWTGTVADMRNGAQMHKNFTRKSQQLAQEKKQYESERNELVDYFRSWKEDTTGERGLAGLEKLLGGETIQRIAYKLAERLDRHEKVQAAEAAGHVPPGTYQAMLQNEELQRDREELQRYKQRTEQQTTDQDVNQRATQTGKRVNQEAIGQFKQLGFTQENGQLTRGVWNMFVEEMKAVWPNDRDPSPTEVRTAVMAAKQRADEYKRADAAEQAEKAARAAKGKPVIKGAAPAGAPAAGKKTVAAVAGKAAMSTAEFKARHMKGGFGR